MCIHIYTPIYRNTFTITFLKLAVSLQQIVQTVTCRLQCQNLKKKGKKHKLKCTFKDYKQKLHETQKIESIQDASGSHTSYTVHKNKCVCKASLHSVPSLSTLKIMEFFLLLKRLFPPVWP